MSEHKLPLKAPPAHLLQERAACPVCGLRCGEVVGRHGLRLVFECERCSVRFHRSTAAVEISERRRAHRERRRTGI